MTTWVLVLFIHIGTMGGRADGVALTNVPHFKSEAECNAAGKASEALVKGTVKELRFVCLPQGMM